MSLQLRTSGVTFRLSVLAITLTGLTGLSASAQTAPQLLPYTSKLVAGGGATATFTVGQTCPVAGAGFTATDTFGDGCFATEVVLSGPRYAAADKSGAIFVSDYTNGLVRRVDPVTGIITAVAGGASSSPAKSATCARLPPSTPSAMAASALPSSSVTPPRSPLTPPAIFTSRTTAIPIFARLPQPPALSRPAAASSRWSMAITAARAMCTASPLE